MINSADCQQSGLRPNYRHMSPTNNMQFNKPITEKDNQQWNQRQQQQHYQPKPQSDPDQPTQLQPPSKPQQPPPQPQQSPPQPQHVETKSPEQQQQHPGQIQEVTTQQEPETDMKPAVDDIDVTKPSVPFWMKTKLQGVKKITNRERRRRQNETLRRLLAPKNALMVLNEMLPGETLANQFKVEPVGDVGAYSRATHAFHAELKVESNVYKGYGETKMAARNAAAEQAIRDLIIKKMSRAMFCTEKLEAMDTETEAGAADEGAEAEAMPMIQLASFALHKLFSEWEGSGHRVPQLKLNQGSNGESPSESPRPAPAKKVRQLPEQAASMHPCMLLTYMRPQLAYRQLDSDGARPQDTVFNVAVDVDGQTFFGKAYSKKEARRMAARLACETIFGVKFDSQ
ncbi:ultrabithorax binding protein 1 [Danaus plexippus plexippus]|uniref:Ultrabithorax binding protein 1 n=1 Tax=Danaus plexippus plexippus TaxID=278856 RepID=A0A212FEJ4_DANPL|nr:double-stranded RNA-specific editase 1-like [Danaus plexippus plexippus]OWR52169.1 ultrabithorax binding protein 1 [Danaus plexippus plexippus]